MRVGGEGLSRSREDDAFRLAFTLLVLDRYPELAESAAALAPSIDTHAVVVEAIRMVDEAEPAVNAATGYVARVVPRAEWLADWVQEAIAAIARHPNAQAVRLGRRGLGWEPIHADFALIKAERGDRWGNLTYRMTARNFGPIMAMAAKVTVASVHEIVELGALDPETVVTPGLFVQHVVKIPRAPTSGGGFNKAAA